MPRCTAPGYPEAFVTVDDVNFMRGGRPYRYVGANLWTAMSLGAAASGDRARLRRELDRLLELGISNVRIMAGSEGADDVLGRVSPTMQRSPGEYNMDVVEGLDYALAEIGARGMSAVLCLNDMWQWSGGFAQYVQWSTGATPPTMPPGAAKDTDWQAHQEFACTFYSDATATRFFEQHLAFLLGRTNSVNGRRYVDDPALMAWELANEPRGLSDASGYRSWIRSATAFIKARDCAHLVTIGSEGETPWPSYVHNEPVRDHGPVDYMTIHIWPQNWGW